MTASWMSGYVADVNYTLGFYRELAPSYLNLACVLNGVDGLKLDRPLRYCELGCGRGYGTVLLAASNPGIEFVGIDFNPSHIAEARSLATRADIRNVTFFEMGFGDAARSSDPRLSDFSVIALHGVYTWVERHVRGEIHQFLREKLLAGGLVYNSYNTLPGWALITPIQHLMMEVGRRSSRNSVAVITEALELFKPLVEHSSAFVVQNPGIKARLERMANQDKNYLVHEFMNTGWEPLYVTEVMESFGEAKLTYIGSASFVENRLDLCVPKNLHAFVQKAPDVRMRELLKDYVVNKQFRRDLYVKGPQQLSQREQIQRLGEIPFASVLMSKDFPQKFQVPIGELSPKKEAIATIFESIGDGISTFKEIVARSEKQGLKEADLIVLLLLLVNSSAIAPALPATAKADRRPSQRLNDVVMQSSLAADSHRFLASPVLGSAIVASFVDRVFGPIVAKAKKQSDRDIVIEAFDRLTAHGQSFRRDGKAIAKTDKDLSEISKLAKDFRDQRLPRWHMLGLLDTK